MKTKTKLVFFLMLLMVLGCAGNVYGFEFGIKGGPETSYSELQYQGFKVGVFTTFPLWKNVVLQPELYVTQRKIPYAGTTVEGFGVHGFLHVYDEMKYVEVPVLVKYTFNLKGDFRPIVFGGVYGAFRVSKNPGFEYEWFETPLKSTNRRFKTMEGGVVIGVGLEHGRGKTKMLMEVRYNHGITTMRELLFSGSVYPDVHTEMTFMVGLGF